MDKPGDTGDNRSNSVVYQHTRKGMLLAAELEELAADMLRQGAPPAAVTPLRRARQLIFATFHPKHKERP